MPSVSLVQWTHLQYLSNEEAEFLKNKFEMTDGDENRLYIEESDIFALPEEVKEKHKQLIERLSKAIDENNGSIDVVIDY